ncbi:GNAT family N-acetyltransferase [Weissella paramesenteroides]|uniref:GNAT family N-acetyltransferase n=1 Tax=Weissella paramesenteroides TaxID=1249 RepID=UPI00123A9D4B|nr:GNAT family N-acetyltransferase [Weissella paramesenteroides]KAA8455452.1 GNAT family N-acetyltransferase [Weissella paramesenteroides]KAA8459446.1 GNAT family N-acetyltransferase [Weissella paramesenteroides]KAA8459543.1 GNAT family N-acetyltransferase [Weissella paramesenteroides]KAA8460744.1 GNAT family N-acetyltransferase [Weissella paramesenteroides]KAA8460987.1 GNAT family N-acetyltransferase [Weissella paramesenteroides]
MVNYKVLKQSNIAPNIWDNYQQQVNHFEWSGAKFITKKMAKQMGNNERVVIALDEDQVVGVGALVDQDIANIPESPYFSTLYVLPDYRSQNIASHIVKLVLNEARILGYQEIYVMTQLKDFYEKLGFQYQKMITDFMDRQMKLYRQTLA